MLNLELLSPAGTADIGIAAIDCGADAVYIAGPDFGARKAAGNSFEDIARLCDYAHKFGVKIFVTYNISVRDDELQELHFQMLKAQEAGADAFIIRDERICSWDDITIPLHASTQCAIRDVERAKHFEDLGCTRIVLERQLSLDDIRKIRSATTCELEFFVHGALCVCYSGECRLSEYIDGRSADRGECIQACRSLYDLADESGKLLVKNKALLSLKDFNLHDRLLDLAEAGVCSFKIEGRLKNASYVRNITRYYDLALNKLVEAYPDKYRRASYGRVVGGFEPAPEKTFNRGYTQLYIDGKKGKWSSMDAPKSMGEVVGKVLSLKRIDPYNLELRVKTEKGVILRNGDGFAFISKNAISGFRGDVCEGNRIVCKAVAGLHEGTILYRNINTAFEKTLERELCHREIPVELKLKIHGRWNLDIEAAAEDGRTVSSPFKADLDVAENAQRAEAMIREQLSKRSEHYHFRVVELSHEGKLPLFSASTLNSIRRLLASDLENLRVGGDNTTSPKTVSLAEGGMGFRGVTPASTATPLMRSKYCVRYELGLCPKYQGSKTNSPLFLLNNGRKFRLTFDCKQCEMTLTSER